MNEEILYARYLVQGANDSLVKRTFVLFYENRDPRVTRKGECTAFHRIPDGVTLTTSREPTSGGRRIDFPSRGFFFAFPL